uniref:Uncharacterized protein n=1 Tax=Astyanax mexicanus TaxID=7994 RepID=A0A3B1KHE5_ASTMX
RFKKHRNQRCEILKKFRGPQCCRKRMHQTSTCPGGVKYISSLIYEENVIRDRITYTEHQGHTNILGYGFRTWLPS